jgi:hypothetical protein
MALLCDPWATLYWIPPGSFWLGALNLGNQCGIRFPLFQNGGQEILNNRGRDRKASWG